MNLTANGKADFTLTNSASRTMRHEARKAKAGRSRGFGSEGLDYDSRTKLSQAAGFETGTLNKISEIKNRELKRRRAEPVFWERPPSKSRAEPPSRKFPLVPNRALSKRHSRFQDHALRFPAGEARFQKVEVPFPGIGRPGGSTRSGKFGHRASCKRNRRLPALQFGTP